MPNNTRRQFLQQMAILAAAQPTAPLMRPFSYLGKEKSLGVALVGLGYYSTEILAPALQKTQHCHLAGIVTGTPEKAAKWQSKYGIAEKNCYNYDNFDQISNNDAIDVVYIVLPNSMHHAFTLRAAAAGKHVWCEKPMAMSVQECTDMIKACADNKVRLSIGYRMQHEPNTQEIIRYRREKTFGKIQNLTCTAGFREWRTGHWHTIKELGGGAMYDMGVYPLNAARYVVGEEPMAVTAVERVHRPELFKGIDETMHFILEFPGGAIANCTTSLGINLRNYLMVNCEDGWYTLSPFSNYNGIEGSNSKGAILNQLVNEPMPHEQIRQMDNDARAILQGEQLLVPGEEGLRDIRVLEAIYRSARAGQRVVIG
jgi:glucose-fructose oxidoreductase